MKTISSRLCIYPKDVQAITGRNYKNSRLLLNKIKLHYKKLPHQFVSVRELSEYTGLDPVEVSKQLV